MVSEPKVSKRQQCENRIIIYMCIDRPNFMTTRDLKKMFGERGYSKSVLYAALESLIEKEMVVVFRDHRGNVYAPNYRDAVKRQEIERYLTF